MALIKCPECGKSISSYADKCIYCGCPMDKIQELLSTVKKSKKLVKVFKKEPKVRPDSFVKTRDEKEQKFISDVTSTVLNSVDNVKINDSSYMYSYRVQDSKGDYKTLGWFSKGAGNKLMFKYYSNPVEKSYQKEFVARTKIPEDVGKIIVKLKREYFEDEKIEEEKSPITENDAFFDGLEAMLRNKRVKHVTRKEQELIEKIYNFVIDEIYANTLKDKIFESKEQFIKLKSVYRYSPVFFDSIVVFKNLTRRVLERFVAFYVSDQVIKIIKDYEKIYNETIVVDFGLLIKSYAEMFIKSGSIEFSKGSSLTSNISFVPNEPLERIVSDIKTIVYC